MSVTLEPAQHLDRWQSHREVGEWLGEDDEPWAAVVHFYAAYHLIRFSLLTDPIFDAAEALKSLHPHLNKRMQTERVHSGRFGDGQFGIVQLVKFLYPKAYPDYLKLHKASIVVRYEDGNGAPGGARLAEMSAKLEQLFRDGHLRHA